jgi:hypothetical protein
MHGSVLGFFAYGALQTGEVADRDVLEVGSLDVNGSVRPMILARRPRTYTGVDVVDGPGVDRVLDAADLAETFGQDSMDVVVSTEMLEHATDWKAAIWGMTRVLRPGGVLVLTTRSPGFPFHHPPDRWRYTQAAFAEILRLLDLEPLVIADDPEHPGVFVKARKPSIDHWMPMDLDDIDAASGVTPMREPLRWLGLPANPDGCGYYRMWQPFAQLQAHSGHEVFIPPPGQHLVDLNEDEVATFDLVTRQRPNGRPQLRDWRRWKPHTRLVYEADDNLLEPDPSGLPAWLDDEIRDSVIDCLHLSDLVTVSTEPLAEVYRPHVADPANVVVLPNAIHADLLTIRRPRRNQITLGWAAGQTHLQELPILQGPLTDLRRTEAFDLHLVGMDYRPLLGGRWTPWQSNLWDYYRAVDFDIALCPLADTAFNRCRTPIKALEAAALGIPVVASDVEPYRGFVVDGVTGFLCRTEADWRARLRELIHDLEARAELGDKARQVAADHTIQTRWRDWAAAYEGVCGR